MLVVVVAGLIGFRGFDSANAVAEKQTVVIDRAADAREAGANAKPAAAVLGSAKPARKVRSRPAKRKPSRSAPRKARARAGLSAPAKPREAKGPAVIAGAPATQAPSAPSAPEKEGPTAAVPATPVDDVVEEVTGVVEKTAKPVESVGDVLLDVRDLLP